MDIKQVRGLLRHECEKADGQATWGRLHGISPAYISDVIQGRREPGKKLLAALGLERIVSYKEVRR